MSDHQNYNKFIPKEILNNNRVLTMSNNRKCNYLIVDICNSTENNKNIITTMMAINTQSKSKDILVIKTFRGKSFSELVDEAYWLCCEHNIKIVLADKNGFGISFIETFEMNINQNNIQIRAVDGRKVIQMVNLGDIINDLKNGGLRFLQSPELAKNTYIKPFLGLSNIMEYHKETSELIDEINNIEVKMKLGNVYLDRFDNKKGKSRVNCLLMFYSYPMSEIIDKNKNDEHDKEYHITKRVSEYEVIHGTFYKYLFKCIENKNINVIFYYSGKNKLEQFINMMQEIKTKELFQEHIEQFIMSKENLEVRFYNGSIIRFIFGGDNGRGYKYHFAVVDKEISVATFHDVIYVNGILFDMAKKDGNLEKDNYNIEFIDM